MLASLLHARTYTVAIDVLAIGIAWYVERLGMGVENAVRALRSWLAGPYRPAQPVHKIREMIDYQYERLPWQKEAFNGTVDLQALVIEQDANRKMVSSKATIVPPSKDQKK